MKPQNGQLYNQKKIFFHLRSDIKFTRKEVKYTSCSCTSVLDSWPAYNLNAGKCKPFAYYWWYNWVLLFLWIALGAKFIRKANLFDYICQLIKSLSSCNHSDIFLPVQEWTQFSSNIYNPCLILVFIERYCNSKLSYLFNI